jgi:ankyrin repeat protein
MAKSVLFSIAWSALLLFSYNTYAVAADPSAELFSAIMAGDIVRAGAALSAGIDINAKNTHGATFLMAAASKGNAEIVKRLLEKGARTNEKTNIGMTALMLAALNDHAEVVKLLLAKGADANIKEKGGQTAFQMAALKGHEQVADILRPRTKGAASIRVKTVIGPLEADQKCLPITKAPDESSERVACLKTGVEVSTAGESSDKKWVILQKPVTGWVPANKINIFLTDRAQAKPVAARSPEQRAAPSQKNESGINSGDLPSSPGRGGGSWWHRGQ